MLISKVKKLSPLERCLYFIKERESVRLKKEAGEPKPWTDDTIIQSYRFCNIRRMDDKVSKWLYENWYKPNYNHRLMLVNVALARFFNLPSTLEFMKFQKSWNPVALADKLRVYKCSEIPNRTLFNGAYMVRGNDGQDKIASVLNYYVAPLVDLAKQVNTDSMEETHRLLCTSYGLGSFMAGQIVADLRWAMNGKWRDRDSWAPIGPGSHRGMNRLLGLDIKSSMNQQQFNTHLARFIDEWGAKLPVSITNRMEAIDYQNCLCEFDKMERTLFDGRHPKQKYPGVG